MNDSYELTVVFSSNKEQAEQLLDKVTDYVLDHEDSREIGSLDWAMLRKSEGKA